MTLDIPETGNYDVALLVPTAGKSLVTLGECDRCRWLPRGIVLGPGQARPAALAAGRHVLTIRLITGDTHDFHVSITPAL